LQYLQVSSLKSWFELMVSEWYPRRTVLVCQSVAGKGIGVVRKRSFLLLRLQIVAIFCQSLRSLKANHIEALLWRSLDTGTFETHYWSHLAKNSCNAAFFRFQFRNSRWVNNFLDVFSPSETYECVRFDFGITCRPNLSKNLAKITRLTQFHNLY